MNINLLQEKLIRAARHHPPSEHVPYAFEQRIMARLRFAGNLLDGANRPGDANEARFYRRSDSRIVPCR